MVLVSGFSEVRIRQKTIFARVENDNKGKNLELELGGEITPGLKEGEGLCGHWWGETKKIIVNEVCD